MTLSWPRLRWPACASRHTSPRAWKISATSRGRDTVPLSQATIGKGVNRTITCATEALILGTTRAALGDNPNWPAECVAVALDMTGYCYAKDMTELAGIYCKARDMTIHCRARDMRAHAIDKTGKAIVTEKS